MNTEYFKTLAAYHRWAYEKLYDQVDRLSDGQYHLDRAMFFDSIHGSLNHLLLADRIWYGRFIDKPFELTGLDQELEEERTRLRDAIFDQCDTWEQYIAGLTESDLASELKYRNTKGRTLEMPMVYLLGHVFNHATHHRGQVSTALTQAGLEAPVMDLPYFLMERM